MVLWFKFRAIGGALQPMLITYVPGVQVSLWLCQAAPVRLPGEWLSTGCPGQDMSMAVSCLSVVG